MSAASEGSATRARPIEEEIVVIQQVLALLLLHIGGEERAQLLLPGGAPGVIPPQHRVEPGLRIDGARIDREAGPLRREALMRLREAELVPGEVHEVGRILAVMDGEIRIEPRRLRIVAQQPRPHGVEGAGPGEPLHQGRGTRAHQVFGDALDPARELGGRAAREGHEQDAARIRAVDDQMGDAMRERVRLP